MIPRRILIAAIILLIPPVLTCSDNPSDGGKVVLPAIGDYVVFAWNDLGMHCLNPTYDQAVILPPYNTVWAQVVRRGDPPQIVTAGLTAEYKILGNTYSYGKRSYGQFWDNVTLLFGADLAHDTGLNLDDPGVHNGLSGSMIAKADHFVVSGIPVTPVDDADEWNPYQVAEITIKDGGGNVVAKDESHRPDLGRHKLHALPRRKPVPGRPRQTRPCSRDDPRRRRAGALRRLPREPRPRGDLA